MIIQGTSLRLTATLRRDGRKLDLTDATNLVMVVKRPAAAAEDIQITIDTATDGTCHVDLAPLDVDEVGVWTYYPACDLQGGGKYAPPAKKFEVLARGTVG
jgi:hypothetical protein